MTGVTDLDAEEHFYGPTEYYTEPVEDMFPLRYSLTYTAYMKDIVGTDSTTTRYRFSGLSAYGENSLPGVSGTLTELIKMDDTVVSENDTSTSIFPQFTTGQNNDFKFNEAHLIDINSSYVDFRCTRDSSGSVTEFLPFYVSPSATGSEYSVEQHSIQGFVRKNLAVGETITGYYECSKNTYSESAQGGYFLYMETQQYFTFTLTRLSDIDDGTDAYPDPSFDDPNDPNYVAPPTLSPDTDPDTETTGGIYVYHNGVFKCINGQSIYTNGEFKLLSSNAKIYSNGVWYPFGTSTDDSSAYDENYVGPVWCYMESAADMYKQAYTIVDDTATGYDRVWNCVVSDSVTLILIYDSVTTEWLTCYNTTVNVMAVGSVSGSTSGSAPINPWECVWFDTETESNIAEDYCKYIIPGYEADPYADIMVLGHDTTLPFTYVTGSGQNRRWTWSVDGNAATHAIWYGSNGWMVSAIDADMNPYDPTIESGNTTAENPWDADWGGQYMCVYTANSYQRGMLAFTSSDATATIWDDDEYAYVLQDNTATGYNRVWRGASGANMMIKIYHDGTKWTFWEDVYAELMSHTVAGKENPWDGEWTVVDAAYSGQTIIFPESAPVMV